MLYTKPTYYDQFKCVADQCEDTCCAGWQIVADQDSLERYKKEKGPYKEQLKQSINWKEGTFKQDRNKRCAFLNNDNLCKMYMALGENSLCKTCSLYPRHIEEFENVREMSLSISCPIVSRLLLENDNPLSFIQWEDEGYEEYEEYEEFDDFLYFILCDGRDAMLSILKDRSLSISVRHTLILGIAWNMQNKYNQGVLIESDEIFNSYSSKKAADFYNRKIEKYRMHQGELFKFSKYIFKRLYKLERLRKEWEDLLFESRQILFDKGKDAFESMAKAFLFWQQQSEISWDIKYEQLTSYFLSTYFPGAVYDGNIYGKAKMSVMSSFMIHLLLMARWKRNDHYLDLDDLCEIAYRFSREFEHSDINLEKMEK